MSTTDVGLLDSKLASTRTYWRTKLMFSQDIIDDPRSIAECAPWYIERVNGARRTALLQWFSETT